MDPNSGKGENKQDSTVNPRTFPRMISADRSSYSEPISSIRNVNTDRIKTTGSGFYKTSTKQNYGKKKEKFVNPHPTTDQKFSGGYKDQGIQSYSPLDDEPAKNNYDSTYNVQTSSPAQSAANQPTFRQIAKRRAAAKKIKIKTTSSKARIKKDRLKCRAYTWAFIRSWVLFMYPFQITLGFYALIAFGVGGTVAKIVSFVGIDITTSALSVGFAFNFLLFFLYGICQNLVVYFMYRIAGYAPLSGRKDGVKMVTLALCLTGTMTPLLNLFPWTLLWTMVIVRYPK